MAEAAVSIAAAKADIANQRVEEAVLSTKAALVACEKLGNKELISEALCLMVDALISSSKMADAMKAITGTKGVDAATLERLKAETLLAQKDKNAAATSAAKAVEMFESQKDKVGAAAALLTKSKVHSSSGQHTESVKAAEAAVVFFNSTGDEAGEARAWGVVMAARLEGGDYKGGVTAALASMALFDEIGNEVSQAGILLQLAEAQLKKSLPAEALQSALGALELVENTGGGQLEAGALAIAVKAYGGQSSEAVSLAKQKVAAARLAGNRKAEAYSLQSLARTYSSSAALGVASEARILCQQAGHKSLEASILKDMASYSLAARQCEDAKEAADQALSILKEFGDADGEKEIQSLLSSIAEAAKKEPEVTKADQESYETDREYELTVLRKSVDAIVSRDEAEYRASWPKLEECQALTEKDWNDAFAVFEEDGDAKDWMELIYKKGPGMRHHVIGHDVLYNIFRMGGMHYGPKFRLAVTGAYTRDKKIPNKYGYVLVRNWFGNYDYDRQLPTEWEGYTQGHAGILDCALHAGGPANGGVPDLMTRWYSHLKPTPEQLQDGSAFEQFA